MKHSWIQTAIVLWIVIFALEMMVTGGTAFEPSRGGNPSSELMNPSFTDTSGNIAESFSFVKQMGSYLISFISMLFLYSPAIFTGYWIWFWFIFCLPIGMTIVVGFVMVLRGVGSG